MKRAEQVRSLISLILLQQMACNSLQELYLDSEINADVGDAGDTDVPRISSVEIMGNPLREITEGHTGLVTINGANLSIIDRVTFGELNCKIGMVATDDILECELSVPHGYSLSSPLSETRAIDMSLWVGDEMIPLDTWNITITPICVSTFGDDEGDGTISNPYRTITQALHQAYSGDTVLIFEGSYSDGEIFPLSIPQMITVRGIADVEIISPLSYESIIQAGPGGSETLPTRLENLNLTTANDGWKIKGGYVEMENVHLNGAGLTGISAEFTTRLTLRDVSMIGFDLETAGCAICASDESKVDASFVGITDAYYGIYATENATVVFDNSEISSGNLGVLISDNTVCSLNGTSITGNVGGIAVFGQASFSAEHTEISGSTQTGFWAYGTSEEFGHIVFNEVDLIGNKGEGFDAWRMNIEIYNSNLSNNGRGLILRTMEANPTPTEYTLVTIVNTRFENNINHGISAAEPTYTLKLDGIHFQDNLQLPLYPDESQLELEDTYTGNVIAKSVTFAFKGEEPYSPPPGTISGPGGYRPSEDKPLHYWIGNALGSITFEK